MVMHPTPIPNMTDTTLRMNTGLRRSEGVEKNSKMRTGMRIPEPHATIIRMINGSLMAERGSISGGGMGDEPEDSFRSEPGEAMVWKK